MARISSQTRWFKRRRFGMGWTPISTQGWLCLDSFIFILILDAAYFIAGGPHPDFARQLLAGLILVLNVLSLLWVCARTDDGY